MDSDDYNCTAKPAAGEMSFKPRALPRLSAIQDMPPGPKSATRLKSCKSWPTVISASLPYPQRLMLLRDVRACPRYIGLWSVTASARIMTVRQSTMAPNDIRCASLESDCRRIRRALGAPGFPRQVAQAGPAANRTLPACNRANLEERAGTDCCCGSTSAPHRLARLISTLITSNRINDSFGHSLSDLLLDGDANPAAASPCADWI